MALALAAFDVGAAPSREWKEPIHFEYAAAPECPRADQVLRQIAAYTTHWTLAGPDEDARRFVVRIVRRDAVYFGQLDIREAVGATARRDIEGDTCEDTALGLSVAVALAIDPHASLTAVGPESPSTDEVPPPPPPPPPPRPPRREEEQSDRDGRAAREAPRTRTPSRPALSLGGRAEANGAVSGVLAVVDIFAELESPSVLTRIPSLRPALRGGVRHAFTRSTYVGRTRAEIGWSAGYLEACPARFALWPRVSIEGCFGANLGQLSAEALDIPGAAISRRRWFDYGVIVGARWQVHPHLFIESVAAMWAPLTRERLRIEPDGVVTEAPASGFSMGLGGGWRF